MIDPHPTYPPELRCEKLGGDQLDLLRKTGLAEPTLRATTLDGEVWEARFGYVVAKKPSDQHGIMYDTLVNTMRAQIPSGVETIFSKVTGIANSDERQQVTLSNGEQISARLVVLANGLNIGLRTMLGIERQVISSCHSITLGFDVAPVGRAAFDFPALTYWPKRANSRMAYMTIFPIGGTMRVNLMVYRDMTDPWLPAFRKAPEAAMLRPDAAPETHDGRLQGKRPDQDPPGRSLHHQRLSAARHRAGRRRLLDLLPRRRDRHHKSVHRRRTPLQRLHPAMARRPKAWTREKIAQFYDDPEKVACEARCLEKAYHLRSLSIDNGLSWRAQRWARFLARLAQGTLRAVRKGFSAGSAERLKVPSGQPRHGRLA